MRLIILLCAVLWAASVLSADVLPDNSRVQADVGDLGASFYIDSKEMQVNASWANINFTRSGLWSVPDPSSPWALTDCTEEDWENYCPSFYGEWTIGVDYGRGPFTISRWFMSPAFHGGHLQPPHPHRFNYVWIDPYATGGFSIHRGPGFSWAPHESIEMRVGGEGYGPAQDELVHGFLTISGIKWRPIDRLNGDKVPFYCGDGGEKHVGTQYFDTQLGMCSCTSSGWICAAD